MGAILLRTIWYGTPLLLTDRKLCGCSAGAEVRRAQCAEPSGGLCGGFGCYEAGFLQDWNNRRSPHHHPYAGQFILPAYLLFMSTSFRNAMCTVPSKRLNWYTVVFMVSFGRRRGRGWTGRTEALWENPTDRCPTTWAGPTRTSPWSRPASASSRGQWWVRKQLKIINCLEFSQLKEFDYRNGSYPLNYTVLHHISVSYYFLLHLCADEELEEEILHAGR